MSKLDILICRPYINFSNESAGVDRYINLLDKLRVDNVSSKLLTTNFIHNQKKYRTNESNIHENIVLSECGGYKKNLSLARIWFEIKFAFTSLKYSYIFRPKVIVVGEPVFLLGFFLMIYKITTKSKLVGDFIDLMPEAYLIKFKSRLIFYIIFWPLVLSRWVRLNFVYDKVISVSSDYFVGSLINRDKIKVFYWGCYDRERSLEQSLERDIIIYAGSLGEGYDIETLIEYGKKYRNFEVAIAGSGPKKLMCQQAHDLGFIKFHGNLQRAELDALYTKSKIAVLPYNKNSAVSMPIKYFEYISNHLFIINSTSMECSRVITDRSIGCNYIPGDVDSFAAAVRSISKMKNDFSAFESLLDTYSVNRIYRDYSKFVASLI